MNPLRWLQQRYAGLDEPLRTERRLELLLLSLLVVMLLQLLWLAWRSLLPPALAPVLPAPGALQIAAPLAGAEPPAAQRLELQARPLFWESRRPVDNPGIAEIEAPAPQPAAPTGQPARRLSDLVLRGVFASADGGGVAIVGYREERRRLRVGEELDGWQLERLRPDAALFVSAGVKDLRRLRELPLAADAAASGDAGEGLPQDAAGPGADAAAPRSESARPPSRGLSTGGLTTGGAGRKRNDG